jgi:hypothetical protein
VKNQRLEGDDAIQGYFKELPDHYGADIVFFERKDDNNVTMHRWQLKLGTAQRKLHDCSKMVDDLVDGLGKTFLKKVRDTRSRLRKLIKELEKNLEQKPDCRYSSGWREKLAKRNDELSQLGSYGDDAAVCKQRVLAMLGLNVCV